MVKINMNNETWKDIPEYEKLYKISTKGHIYSYKHDIIVSQRKNNKGYMRVDLHKDGKYKSYLVHRLVALTFIPNPENKPEVNHLDENKENNCVENLEWTTYKENRNYGSRNEKISISNTGRKTPSMQKQIYCIELNKTFNSLKEASKELNINCGNLSSALHGRYNSAGGYLWKFTNNQKKKRERIGVRFSGNLKQNCADIVEFIGSNWEIISMFPYNDINENDVVVVFERGKNNER